MQLLEQLGDGGVIVGVGLMVGLLFGAFAQQSQFCLRAATVEFWHMQPGSKLAIWLLVFTSALISTQWLLHAEWVYTESIRQLNGIGSLSGALIGGLLFGSGMILARGCASRLLVLSATGNLRALVTGLLLILVAQASLRGVLSPLRMEIASWWTISGSVRSVQQYVPDVILLGGVGLLLAAGIVMSLRSSLSYWKVVCAVGVGLTVSLGWYLTALHAGWAFDGGTVQSVSFTGPSADTLMALVNSPDITPAFGIALVPGVFLGSLVAAIGSRQWQLQAFDHSTGMLRYLVGAVFMGFGSMLAGGCAVGAGVTGGSVLATTAFVALFAMWIGAGLTELMMSEKVGKRIRDIQGGAGQRSQRGYGQVPG